MKVLITGKNSYAGKEFIKRIPKTDLHLHLDGSIRISTLIELAKENGISLPSAGAFNCKTYGESLQR